MKKYSRFCAVVLASQLGACASLVAPAGDTHQQLSYWLERQDFAQAAALVSASPTEDNILQKTLAEQINGYEQKTINSAETAAAENHWPQALALYQQALEKLPASQALQQASQALNNRYAEKREKAEQERLIAKSTWLIQELAISELTAPSASSDWLATDNLSQQRTEAAQLTEQLCHLGEHALAEKNLALAARVLPLAEQLSPNARSQALQVQWQSLVKEQESQTTKQAPVIEPKPEPPKAQPSPAVETAAIPKPTKTTEPPSPPTPSSKSAIPDTEMAQEQKKNKRMLADFKKALNRMDFAEARQLMETLAKQGVDSAAFAKLSKQLDEQVAGQVKHLTEVGVNYYSLQQYDEAMKVWKQAQTLDPNNEKLGAHIERVTKVLEKLQDLRNKRRG
ncbi:hypothetical protein JCM14076_19110 [Methylosoma difficile]